MPKTEKGGGKGGKGIGNCKVCQSRPIADEYQCPGTGGNPCGNQLCKHCLTYWKNGEALDKPICLRCATPPTTDRMFSMTVGVPGSHGEDQDFPDPWVTQDPWKPSMRHSYPVFEWDFEEGAKGVELTEQQEIALSAMKEDHKGNVRPIFHSSTRLPSGEEGLLVDCGAVDNLTGLEFIRRQTTAAEMHGLPTVWEKLAVPKRMAGVGKTTEVCTHQAGVYCILQNGTVLIFTAPVIPPDSNTGEPSTLPPLYGLNSMAERNTYMGTRHGVLAQVPDGEEDKIQWPPGTVFLQCKKTPSGHWLLGVSNWKLYRPSVANAASV